VFFCGFRGHNIRHHQDEKTLASGDATMDMKDLLTVFAAVFSAEPGNKTRLATRPFAADKEVSKWTVFPGASWRLDTAQGLNRQ
jgi:putative Ca2+/H+ antiporter (TMEM165/GDT1 family)